MSSENTVVTLTKRKGTTQERTPLQRRSNSDQIQTNSLDRARRWPTSTLISLAVPRSPDLLRLSVRDRSGEGRGQGGLRLPVQFSGFDQKSAARCETACGNPRQRSSKTCSQPPAVTGPLLCGPVEVDTEAASLGSSQAATGLVSAHSEEDCPRI